MRIHHTPILRYWILFFSLALGGAIRLWASIHQPVFSEEAFSIFESHFYPFPYDPSYPPLYPLFLTLWTKISTSLWWVRLPNVIAGTASIFLFWRMISTHLNKKFADLGAILISTSSLHIHYSWVARPHAFTMFVALISLAHLWHISDIIRKKKPMPHGIIGYYVLVNTIGALLSHGYTMFLTGSLLALIFWAWKSGALPYYWNTHKRGLALMSLHIILPVVQLACIIGRLQPLIDSAAWIPEFSIKSITSVLLTLTNVTKTLTGEMYATALISIYVSLAALFIVFHALYRASKTKIPFIVLLSVCVSITSIICCAVVYMAFDMTIFQPRLLLPIHLLYLLCLTVTLPVLISRFRYKTAFSSVHWHERIFIILFLMFSIRSLVLLNIYPYYTSPRIIKEIIELKKRTDEVILVFPRYEVITVKYLWGLSYTYPSLRATDKLLALPNESTIEHYLRRIPQNRPLHILLLTPINELSPGAQEFIKQISPSCSARPVDNIAILSCPPLTHEY